MTMHLSLDNPHLKRDPFTPPPGYLQSLTGTVMSRIGVPMWTARPAAQSSFVRFIPWLGVACVTVLAVLFSHYAPASTWSDNADAASPAATYTESDQAYDYLMATNTLTYDIYETE